MATALAIVFGVAVTFGIDVPAYGLATRDMVIELSLAPIPTSGGLFMGREYRREWAHFLTDPVPWWSHQADRQRVAFVRDYILQDKPLTGQVLTMEQCSVFHSRAADVQLHRYPLLALQLDRYNGRCAALTGDGATAAGFYIRFAAAANYPSLSSARWALAYAVHDGATSALPYLQANLEHAGSTELGIVSLICEHHRSTSADDATEWDRDYEPVCAYLRASNR